MIIDSPIISGSYAASGSLDQFGNVVISGSLTVTGSIIGNITGSADSASYAANATSASYALTSSFSLNVPVTASYANNANSASFATTASNALTASYLSGYVSPFPFTGSAIISGSLEVTGSANIPNITGSLSGSLNGTASYAVTASNAVTASYLTGYVSPFPFTGSAVISGSLGVSGSLQVTNLSGSGVRYLVADESGSITAQSASAALKSTQAFTSTAGQTTFSVTNGYSTGYVDVFINGSKLNSTEFTDTSGTNIVLATGSFVNDIVEVVKYTPAAGVTNNVLRQLTTFTASAGQTVFSASYTPGLIDIFYNGSRLTPADFTANNGTFFTLATGSAANDILDVLVYSYQVGAFSGIGGVGTADQIAYFGTTNSITGSPNFTISGSTMTVTGSLIVSGSGTFTNIGPAVFSGSITSTAGFTGSFSGTATSASYASTASFVANAQSASYVLNAVSSSFATSAVTASYADSLTVTGTLTAQTLVVQTITSSVDFVTGSTRFGSSLSTSTHQFTGSVSVTGSITQSGNNTTSSFAGKIGINSIAPSTQLHIVGTGGNIFSDGLRVARDGVPSQYALLNMLGGGYNFLATNSTTGEPAFTWLTSTDGTSYSTRMTLNGASYMLDVSGSGRFTGALTGTSATFSGNLNLQGSVTRNINFYDSSNTNINAQIQYDQIASNSGQLFFGTNNAGTFATRLTISSAGATTFSGASTFNGNTIALNGNNPSFTFNTSAANLYNYISFGAGSAGASIFLLGNTYNTVGPYIASGLTLTGQAGGINLNVETAAGSVSLYTGTSTERFRVGNIGFAASIIGASDANSKIFLGQISSDCGLIPIPAGTTLYCYNRNSGTNYRALITTSTYFTGQHGNKPVNLDLKTNIQNYIGLIVSSAGTFYSVNPITQEVTTGKDAIQISEALPEIKLTDTDQDKAVWGVVTNVKNDNYNTDGTVEIDNNTEWADRLGDNVVRVNGLGEGAIWITNINGNIENGDYICSSVIPGYGRKQNDDLLHNYTVAKSTMDCNFDLNNNELYVCEEFEYEGQTYKKAFIGCTYHCA
jgi:hypothetical protein